MRVRGTVTGAILIEAPGGALNMSGSDEGVRTDNTVAVKYFKVGKNKYPYISGQAWRRWLREVLYEDFGWEPSPVTREKKSAYTEGDPIQYAEDDLFGYMAARKKPKKGEEKEGVDEGTFKRTAPLKNSLLISVAPNTIADDFGHFSRNLQDGENYIPFEHQCYNTYFQGTFSIVLNEVGLVRVGEMRDIGPERFKVHAEKLSEVSPDIFAISAEERAKRVGDVLKAIARLRHGAQLTRNLVDVSPVVAVIGFLNGGNAPFQKLFRSTDGEGVEFDVSRFLSVLKDYEDSILEVDGNKVPIFIGYRPSVLTNELEMLTLLEEHELVEICDTPRKAFEKAAEYVNKVYGL